MRIIGLKWWNKYRAPDYYYSDIWGNKFPAWNGIACKDCPKHGHCLWHIISQPITLLRRKYHGFN